MPIIICTLALDKFHNDVGLVYEKLHELQSFEQRKEKLIADSFCANYT